MSLSPLTFAPTELQPMPSNISMNLIGQVEDVWPSLTLIGSNSSPLLSWLSGPISVLQGGLPEFCTVENGELVRWSSEAELFTHSFTCVKKVLRFKIGFVNYHVAVTAERGLV